MVSRIKPGCEKENYRLFFRQLRSKIFCRDYSTKTIFL